MNPTSHFPRSSATTNTTNGSRTLTGDELFQEAVQFKKINNHISALECAKKAEQAGASGSMYTLGKMYQVDGMMDHARIRLSIAANDYKHREAAVEMIKMLYEDLVTDHSQIEKLSAYVSASRAENEISEQTNKQDVVNMLTIGELHLQNISWRSDKTEDAKKLLESIRELVANPQIDPMRYPKMDGLAQLNPSTKQYAVILPD